MKKIARFIFVVLVMLAVPATAFLSAQNRPPVHWVNGGESIAVKQGEAFDFQAQFYSDVDIPNASWCLTGRTGALIKPDNPNNHNNTCGFIGNVETNRIFSIQFQLQVPQNIPPGLYPGDLLVFNQRPADVNGGAWQFPEFLHVKIYVMDAKP